MQLLSMQTRKQLQKQLQQKQLRQRTMTLEAAKEDGTAFVFMGHGTSHTAKVSYIQMQTQMEQLGYENVFIGTVEGEPEDTACEAVIEK